MVALIWKNEGNRTQGVQSDLFISLRKYRQKQKQPNKCILSRNSLAHVFVQMKYISQQDFIYWYKKIMDSHYKNIKKELWGHFQMINKTTTD